MHVKTFGNLVYVKFVRFYGVMNQNFRFNLSSIYTRRDNNPRVYLDRGTLGTISHGLSRAWRFTLLKQCGIISTEQNKKPTFKEAENYS